MFDPADGDNGAGFAADFVLDEIAMALQDDLIAPRDLQPIAKVE